MALARGLEELEHVKQDGPLVADDDRTVRAVLTRILEAEGFKVLQAQRGGKCLFLLDGKIY